MNKQELIGKKAKALLPGMLVWFAYVDGTRTIGIYDSESDWPVNRIISLTPAEIQAFAEKAGQYYMNPERKYEIDGNIIEEFYWNSKRAVYVNHIKVDDTYDAVCKRLREATEWNDPSPKLI